MKKNKFKQGDVVKLKSGGPKMTIDEVPSDFDRTKSDNGRTRYLCRWFKGGTSESASFAEALLEFAEVEGNKESKGE